MKSFSHTSCPRTWIQPLVESPKDPSDPELDVVAFSSGCVIRDFHDYDRGMFLGL